jgi:hypothetical protein
VCQQLGITPSLTPWDQNGTPEAFVVSMNFHRQHLKLGEYVNKQTALPAPVIIVNVVPLSE